MASPAMVESKLIWQPFRTCAHKAKQVIFDGVAFLQTHTHIKHQVHSTRAVLPESTSSTLRTSAAGRWRPWCEMHTIFWTIIIIIHEVSEVKGIFLELER